MAFNPLTPDDFEPNPKNPVIAAFFRNIGLADELGSGVRKLFKYVLRYSGKEPQMLDGDIFRTIVPLDDSYSFDAELGKALDKTPNKTPNKASNKTPTKPRKSENRVLIEDLIIEYVKENPQITQKEIIDASGKSKRVIQDGFAGLQSKGILMREGSKMNGCWVLKK